MGALRWATPGDAGQITRGNVGDDLTVHAKVCYSTANLSRRPATAGNVPADPGDDAAGNADRVPGAAPQHARETPPARCPEAPGISPRMPRRTGPGSSAGGAPRLHRGCQDSMPRAWGAPAADEAVSLLSARPRMRGRTNSAAGRQDARKAGVSQGYAHRGRDQRGRGRREAQPSGRTAAEPGAGCADGREDRPLALREAHRSAPGFVVSCRWAPAVLVLTAVVVSGPDSQPEEDGTR